MRESVRRRRRRHDEEDWQSQLQVTSSLVLVSDEEPVLQLRREKRRRWLRRSLNALAGMLLVAAVLFLAADPHKAYAKYLAVLGPATLILGHMAITFVGVISSRRKARRRRERGEAPLDVAIRRLLYSLGEDAKWFLANPPTRQAYADWVASGTERLHKLSPEIAAEWAQPDPTDRVTGMNVSAQELEARLRRIADLRRTVMDAWNPHADSLTDRVRGQVRALEAGRYLRRG